MCFVFENQISHYLMQAVGSVEAGVGSSEFVMDGRLRFMDRLLASTFLLFRDNHRLGSSISIWRLILALFLLSLGKFAKTSKFYRGDLNFQLAIRLAIPFIIRLILPRKCRWPLLSW